MNPPPMPAPEIATLSTRHAEGVAVRAPGTPGWLGPLFGLAAAAPGAMHLLRPVACRVAPAVSEQIREATRLNARRIFGRSLTAREQRRFTRRVAGSFFDFLLDVARASSLGPDQLRRWIDEVDGLDTYLAARATRRGAILVTAHLGSFEAGLAALASHEPRIRVVFRRDASADFDRLRSQLRRRLGIVESAIDEGWSSWMPLREALLNDEVIVMQGDRAIPGQRSRVLPFLHGHLRMPTGPVRLARLTGSPIIPVFAPRGSSGRRSVVLGVPIEPSTTGDADLTALSQAIQEAVARYPDQWLALAPAFEEDAPDAR